MAASIEVLHGEIWYQNQRNGYRVARNGGENSGRNVAAHNQSSETQMANDYKRACRPGRESIEAK
jgi:hypothetical protein